MTSLCEVHYKWNALKMIHMVDGNIYIETFMREFIFLGRDSLSESLRKEIIDKIQANTDIRVLKVMPDLVFG
ncbi:hypothetical protein [Alkalibaculum bacchi]|uniref:hypothetical protein n=1 Tax=Alkalibaculum bacchi TaxID=645887 RepID=UPI0026F09178|nr:hypothetical protein [Alkalibaculum bacchi]